MLFQSEAKMVDVFLGILEQENLLKCDQLALEFNYSGGRTDVVALTSDGKLISFEAKLSKWKEALQQAYRNQSYAHSSYVVFPKKTAHNAIKHRHEFERRGVGICSLADNKVVINLEAATKEPLQPWLTQNAREFIEGRVTVDI